MKKFQPILLLFILISTVNLISEKNVKWLRVNYSNGLDFISEQEKYAQNLKKLIPNVKEVEFASRKDVVFDDTRGDFLPTYLLSQYIFSPFVLKNNDENNKYIVEYCDSDCGNSTKNKLLARSGNYYLYMRQNLLK